jgi:hypothetical protein
LISDHRSQTRRCGSRASSACRRKFWLGLQMDYDLETTRASIGARLEQELTPRAA